MLRLKPQQYWAIIITLLFHAVVFWGLFVVEVQKKGKNEPFELELEAKKDELAAEKVKQSIEELATQELKELLSNKAAKRAVSGERFSEQQTTENIDVASNFEQQKEVLAKLRAKAKKALKNITTKQEIHEKKDSLPNKQTVFYVGNSRVEYFLAERYRVHLPIPVYKCEGAGTVEVAIQVNAKGRVIKAEIIKKRSRSASECMKEAALQAALTSVFSERNGYAVQGGRIVYQFAHQ